MINEPFNNILYYISKIFSLLWFKIFWTNEFWIYITCFFVEKLLLNYYFFFKFAKNLENIKKYIKYIFCIIIFSFCKLKIFFSATYYKIIEINDKLFSTQVFWLLKNNWDSIQNFYASRHLKFLETLEISSFKSYAFYRYQSLYVWELCNRPQQVKNR